MNVYVVLLQEGWDGYGGPVAAFSTLEAAKEYVHTRIVKHAADVWHIFELELDHPAD